MKGQGQLLRMSQTEKKQTNYYLCIVCKKKPRDKAFFCEKCFKKPFEERLRVFCDWQIKKGFKIQDPYMLEQKHFGRLKDLR